MYPRPTEGRGKALVLLQVWQRVVVKLHRLAGKPPAEFVDSLLHPASGYSVKAKFCFVICSDAAPFNEHSPAHELVPSVQVKDFPPEILS